MEPASLDESKAPHCLPVFVLSAINKENVGLRAHDKERNAFQVARGFHELSQNPVEKNSPTAGSHAPGRSSFLMEPVVGVEVAEAAT